MRLSVIVPVYNERQGVAETLAAILKAVDRSHSVLPSPAK